MRLLVSNALAYFVSNDKKYFITFFPEISWQWQDGGFDNCALGKILQNLFSLFTDYVGRIN
jgi:hypothetical protein